MIITNECRATNKLGLLLELTRADEALMTLLEHEYDEETEMDITLDTLDYLGLRCELEINRKEYPHSEPLFDELQTLCACLSEEIENNDWIIHRNKKYGYDQPLEYYKEYNMVL